MKYLSTTLGEYYDVRDGTHDSPKYVKEGYPLVTSKNLKEGKLDFKNIKYISEKDFNNINKRSEVNIGDVLMAMIGTIGNPVEIIEKTNFAIKNVALFKTNENQSSKYLKYFLIHPTVRKKFNKDAKGTTQKFVGLNYLRNFPISVPSINDQKEIANSIENVFNEIDKMIFLERNKIQEANKLKETLLEKLFNNENLQRYRLNQVCDFIGGSQPPKSFFESKQSYTNIRLIQIRDYKSNKNIVFIPKDKARRFCKKSDVMIGRYGPPIFQILRGLEGAYNVALMKAVPKPNILNDYLFFFLKNKRIQDYVIKKSQRAAGQSGVNKESLEPYPVFLPSLDDQKIIIAKAEKINLFIEKLLNNSKNKIESYYLLKDAILIKKMRNLLI